MKTTCLRRHTGLPQAAPFRQDAEWIRNQEYAYIANQENQIRIVEEEGVSLEPVPWDTPAELFARYLTKHLYGGRVGYITSATTLDGRRWDKHLFIRAGEEFERDGHGTVEVSTAHDRFPEEHYELAEAVCDGSCFVRVEASWLAREENYTPGQNDLTEGWTDGPEHFVDYTYSQTQTRFLDPLYADRQLNGEFMEPDDEEYTVGVIEAGITERDWLNIGDGQGGPPKISFDDFRKLFVAGRPDLSKWDPQTNSVISAQGGA